MSDDDKVSLKEHLTALMKERDERVALALAALSKNRSETAAVEYFHR